MKAILVQQGLWDALKFKGEDLDKKVDDKSNVTKQELMEKAHSTIILSLGDGVLREVCKEKTAAAVWAKLESIYMTKSLANRLFMKQRLFFFKFQEGKGISDQLQEFSKTIDDLENIDVAIEDEDKAIILLNSLPKSFDQLKDAMLYGRYNTITLEEVMVALKTKEIQSSSSNAGDQMAESEHQTRRQKGFQEEVSEKKNRA